MKRLIGSVLTLVGFLAAGGTVSAQGYGGYGYPQGVPHYSPPYLNNSNLSPYLNLLRGGDTATNYYLGVIPEFQRRANYAQLRSAIDEVEQRVAAPLTDSLELARPLDQTGHATAFGYYSSYYPQLNSRPGQPQTPGAVGRPR